MRWKLILFAASLACPMASPAQSGLDRWENLQRLRPGQKIEIVDLNMRSLVGAFEGFTDEAISFGSGKGAVSIPRDQVASVKIRESSKRRRNVLVGLALGAAGGLAAGAIHGALYHEKGETGVFMMVYAPAGAGIGAAAGAALPAGTVTVYRISPGPTFGK